jgi:methionyl-tRNA formyltransferase
MGDAKMMNEKGKFNVLFITQEDPFYVKAFFEEFLENYPDISDIKGVAICGTLGKKSFSKLLKQLYDFYGMVGFMLMGLRYVFNKVMLQVGKFVKTDNCYSLNQLFDRYGIYSENRNDINSAEFVDKWRKENIDIIISVASSVIFKESILALPRWGCINIHHAKLPKYRGMLPNFWQMYHNEKTAGITVHKINLKIDDGDILLQKEIEILPDETLDHLITRSKRIGAKVMIEVIERIRENRLNPIKNDSKEGSYFTFPNKEEVKEFKRRGKRIL